MNRLFCLMLIFILLFSSLSVTALAAGPLYGTEESSALSFEELLESIDKPDEDDTAAWIVGVLGVLITAGGLYYYFIKKRNDRKYRQR